MTKNTATRIKKNLLVLSTHRLKAPAHEKLDAVISGVLQSVGGNFASIGFLLPMMENALKTNRDRKKAQK